MTKHKTIRKGTTVVMQRAYAADEGTSIAYGATVRVVGMSRSDFNCRLYDVTDGVSTVRSIPRHAIKVAS